jgi:transcription-repair coupling factor (superfamily II helicase)
VDAFDVIRADPQLEALRRHLAREGPPVAAEGLWGSSAPIVSALAAQQLGRPLLLLTAHAEDADQFRDDIATVVGTPPELLPQLEMTAHDTQTSDELAGERLRLCLGLVDQATGHGAALLAAAEIDGEAPPPPCIVAPLLALMQPVPAPEVVAEQSLTLTADARLEPDALAAWLDGHGFTRCDQVEVPGDYARRGGIIDVFSNAQAEPVRVEFLGDEIASIRFFDAGTQRSARAVHSVRVPALSVAGAAATVAAQRGAQTTSFLALLPRDTIVALHEPGELQELGRTYWQRLGERAGIIPVENLLRRAADFTQLRLERFPRGAERSVPLPITSLPQLEPKASEALRGLAELAGGGSVWVLCDNRAEQQRFGELLTELGQPAERVHTTVGVLHRGFRWRETAFVPHHEVFGRQRQRRALRRVATGRPLDTFLDLQPGDHVVHVLHGIGRFNGLKTLEHDGRSEEYLVVEFADQATLHVPVSQIHVVQKYVGSVRGRPKLSKLGGTAWKRTTERVAAAVTDLAAELLRVQAQRATQAGIAYPADTDWQREFEGSFAFDETEDQLRALDELKRDMGRPRPMDRLLCGDVGYGKTELAIRAAFKTVEYGKQVAVLVPTTVLAEQHYQTFSERMADYPFRVEAISRFRTKREQDRIVERARRGEIDVLIGTHRLLSADVHFADLGLVIIDEEQRFGVEAKERLKQMRATVDVLTLSATPIPRTLHMSMLGLRDISVLQTPPLDRRSIVTQVRHWDDRLVRDAVVRELNRDGQVYFVHNFVRDLHSIANRLRAIVPEARVVIGHGQMGGAELERVMLAFLRREADVLVSTNIIESGLDIPSANTIIIHRPERFGLADLHQLRGRVGRSKHRAYAYLLLSPKHPLQDTAARRLKAIEHYSDLGAGFQIAMRDLELRGAGNILGPEQSGHIEAVGYEMYCQLLDRAVRHMRHEPERPTKPVNVDLGLSASIPRAYIRAERQRMDVYKRLTACAAPDDIRVLSEDLRDAFGPLPDEVQLLLDLAELRVLAARWSIRAIVLKPPDVIFAVDDLRRVDALFREGPGSPRMPDPKTVHWRLPARHLEMPTLLAILRKQLSRPPEAPAAAGAAAAARLP